MNTESSSTDESDIQVETEEWPEPDAGGTPRERPDPTRYGDWERAGRCIDF